MAWATIDMFQFYSLTSGKFWSQEDIIKFHRGKRISSKWLRKVRKDGKDE